MVWYEDLAVVRAFVFHSRKGPMAACGARARPSILDSWWWKPSQMWVETGGRQELWMQICIPKALLRDTTEQEQQRGPSKNDSMTVGRGGMFGMYHSTCLTAPVRPHTTSIPSVNNKHM